MKLTIFSTFTGILVMMGIFSNLFGGKKDYKKAPDFRLISIKGDTITLSDFKGHVIFLNFWATWCPPCRAEIPALKKIYEKYRERGFTIIGVALDDPEKVKNFSVREKINYPVVYGDTKVEKDYGGIFAIPTTFVIDKNGFIVQKIVGARTEKEFEEVVKSLLGSKK